MALSERVLDDLLVTEIAQTVDRHEITNVLWGEYLMTIYGIPTFVDGMGFIVADEAISSAYNVLKAAGLKECGECGGQCRYTKRLQIIRPPSSHLHLSERLYLTLYAESTIPGSHQCLLPLPNKYTTSSSDSKLPPKVPGYSKGAFASSLYPVRIPTPAYYTELLIRLIVRDWRTEFRSGWLALLTYVPEYMLGTPVLQEQDLQPCLLPILGYIDRAEGQLVQIFEDLEQVL